MRFLIPIALTLTLLSASNKKALLIGNSQYEHLDKLSSPSQDIPDLAKKLRKMGFEVVELYNLDEKSMKKAIKDFKKRLLRNPNAIALFYYSGHGSQAYGESYLIPIDGDTRDQVDVEADGIKVETIAQKMATANTKANILFLDACRDVPIGAMGGTKGLGQVKRQPSSTLILYSTSKNKTANDDRVFNRVVLSKLGLNQPFSLVVNDISYTVGQKTGGSQVPELLSTGLPNIILGGEVIPPPSPPPNEPQMVHINRGSFIMGSNNGDSDEKPPHRVTIDYDFEIGKYEVTIGEYKACVADGGCKQPIWLEKGNSYNIHTGSNNYYKKMCLKDNCPIIGVSWNNAKAYTKWLSKKTGKNYRLPTEAEWEFVARAGITTKWSFGNSESDLCSYGNVADKTAKTKYSSWTIANCRDGYIHTAPIGSFRPNPWGVYDMHGNVWEWCEDWCLDSYNSTPRDGSANHSQKDNYKVLRGGSWFNLATITRSANRNWDYPTNRNDNVGFRLQRTLP